VFAHVIERPGRGNIWVWECTGPPGAATLLLLHGVTLTAELNWGKVMAPLGRHFRLIALDLPGHGHPGDTDSRFRLEDCADDAAAVAGILNINPVIAVGYSMGGMVAQLLCQRHPQLLSGLVLCATAGKVPGSPLRDLIPVTLAALRATMGWNAAARLTCAETLGAVLLGHIPNPTTRRWAREQLRRTSLINALCAVQSVYEFTSDNWIGQIPVPTAVVITTRDRIVPAGVQRKLAHAIPNAFVYEVEADHGLCVNSPEVFTRALLAACRDVARNSRRVCNSRTQQLL